ncbi:Rdx family protein [Haloferax denitrificans]|uniref:Rdx family protein n=1 Tax=Haloferax denitrificans TaxID=35745 RepID=UPI003C6F3946
MTEVEIEYCVPCGFLDRVALVTGDHGVLTVTVDGERVWDKSEDEFDPDLVLRRVRPHVG